MALLQLCKQLERIRQSIAGEDALLAYRIERLHQNIRLDFPSIQQPPNFLDNNPYPDRYPQERGPFVAVARENSFIQTLQNQLNQLNKIVHQIEVATDRAGRLYLWDEYVGLLSKLECVKPFAMEDVCNQENRLAAPKKLCRYLSLSGFLYTLLKQDKSRIWTNNEIRDLGRQLKGEVDKPSHGWMELARAWNQLRKDIRNGFSFDIKPQRPNAVWFWTDGERPVHTPNDIPNPDSALKIVKDLGLPGWDRPDDKFFKLGVVAIWLADYSLCTYRPTMLDILGNNCYFFLPASRPHGAGLTWPLTNCCRYNDFENQNGFKEWTTAMPTNGIPASIIDASNSNPEPAFELAGLFFSSDHAKLFIR